MDIDLGEKPKANVKVGGQSYEMSLPSVIQAQKFSKGLKENEGDEFTFFVSFVSELGMPKDVAEGLAVHQLTKLAEGLMGDPKKK